MSKLNSSRQIIETAPTLPRLKPQLFVNLNAYADSLYTRSPKIAYSIPRPLKAKSPKKSTSFSSRNDMLAWYSIKQEDTMQTVEICIVSFLFILCPQCRFRNMSPSEKIVASAIKNPQFIYKFCKWLPIRTPTMEFNLESDKSINTLIANSQEYFQQVVLGISIACCSQPILYLSQGVVKDGAFVEWMDRVSSFKLFEYNSGQDNLLWFSSKTFHPLSHFLVNQLEKQIFAYYYNKVQFYHQVTQLRQFFNTHNKHHLIEALEIPLLKFGATSEKDLNKMQEKIKIEEEKLLSIKAQKILEQMQYLQKGKKSRKKGKKKGSNKQRVQQEQKLQQKLVEAQMKYSQHKLNLSQDSSVQKSCIDQTQSQTQMIVEIQINQQSVTILPALKQIQEIIPNQCLQEKAAQQQQCSCFHQTEHSQQFSQDAVSEEISQTRTAKKKKKKDRKDREMQAFKGEICHKFMTRQLENIVQFINSQTNKMLQARVMAFQRVRIFIQNTYPFSNAILFGSNAIGLSLAVSDVDILLIGFQCNSRNDSGELLNHIAYMLNCMGWVVNCEVYSNAKVPVIKLQIDTSVPYIQLKGSNSYYNSNQGYFFLQTEMEKMVKVDITVNVEGISSAGYDSTLLMKKWLQKYPMAQKIIILFKHILSYKKLNQNYRGGIGSYCLFVMVMAYIHQYSKDAEIELSKLFVKILHWYSEEFNSDKQIVWLREDGPCFINEEDYQMESEQRRGLLRLVDPTTKRIMSGSCSQYVKIKAFFKEILEQIMSIEQMVKQELSSQSQSHMELTKIFQNKKQSQRWFRNTNQRHGWALKNLLGMKD